MTVFIRMLQITAAIGAGWLLASQLHGLYATLVVVALALTGTLGGAAMLRSTRVGEIDWRNHLVGWLLPWGYRIGNGKLSAIVVTSLLVWSGLGVLGVIAEQTGIQGQASVGATQEHRVSTDLVTGLTLLSWLVDGSILLYLGGQLSRQSEWRRSPGLTIAKSLGVVGVILLASLVLRLSGFPVWALLVSGGPPLVLGTLYGLWVVMILTIGRNARWN